MPDSKLSLDSPLELERQYRLQWEPAQNSHVLLFPEGMVKLQGGSAEIMQRVDGKTSANGIVEALTRAFPGADLRRDVLDFLEVAHGKGWIRTKQD